MKTTVPSTLFLTCVTFGILFSFSAIAQSGPGGGSGNVNGGVTTNLTFKNPSLITGNAGADNAVYRFPNVSNNTDALVKINARSSSQVKLETLDVSNAGFDKAFQPQVSYNDGHVNSATSWWMEFKITFVTRNTTTPVNMSTVYATALDVDGDDTRLRERVSFFSPNAYILENPTNLSVSNLVQNIQGVLTNVGKSFDGIIQDHSGIDTNATNLMATMTYNNSNTIIYRAGAFTTGSSSRTERNYSVYFKNFNYVAPIVSLPVKLVSFNAMLNQAQNKVDLTWSTASEINVSHFTVEKSYDGKTFSDAGLVFAFGNTTEKMNYSFADNVKNANQPVIYYRLRSTDNDGKFELSETRIIRLGKAEETVKLMTYPNPVTNELRVTLPSAWQGKAVVLEVFNQSGVRLKVINAGSASQTETIRVSDLAKGFYVIKASCGAEIAQQRIIKD